MSYTNCRWSCWVPSISYKVRSLWITRHAVLCCTGSGGSGQDVVNFIQRKTAQKEAKWSCRLPDKMCYRSCRHREGKDRVLTKGLRSPRAKQTIENTALKVKRNKNFQRQRKLPRALFGSLKKALCRVDGKRMSLLLYVELHYTLWYPRWQATNLHSPKPRDRFR